MILARWHIAMVEEVQPGEGNTDSVQTIVGMITLEDVIEEMLQREIIEETDLFSKLSQEKKNFKSMFFFYSG